MFYLIGMEWMDSIMEAIPVAVPFVALFLLFLFFCALLYNIKRNGFYISVNCWFCNRWTKVQFSDRNSFYCRCCLQYNGFNKDGGYNKVIEEQFDTSFNKRCHTIKNKTEPVSNGLCMYCNINQQLKVQQLANFTPLNEENYDVEIEHFRIQLEKSYKLCKKCDRVLKKTLEKQYIWMFGNRIKNLQRKGLSLLNKSNKLKGLKGISKKSIAVNLTRYFLILISFILFCRALNAIIIFHGLSIKKYIPEAFLQYTILLNDLWYLASNMTKDFMENMSNKLNFYPIPHIKNLKIIKNNLSPATSIGLILEMVLLIWQPNTALWKINDLLGWIILSVTSFNGFQSDYSAYINIVQIFSSAAILYSLGIRKQNQSETVRKKFIFKKLQVSREESDFSDTDEELYSSYCRSSHSRKSYKGTNDPVKSHCSSHSQNFLFKETLRNTANLNLYTATSTNYSSSFNTCSKNSTQFICNNGLHNSLENLHLSNSSSNSYLKSYSSTSAFSVNSPRRPILSPSKLENVTNKPWTRGFWKNDTIASTTFPNMANLSQSSSQSSGFVSSNEPVFPNPYNSFTSSRGQSVFGDFEKVSFLSEPAYHFKPIKSNSVINQSQSNIFNSLPQHVTPRENQINLFSPVLKPNTLFAHTNNIPSHNFENSFSKLSLRSSSVNSNKFNSPGFREKPFLRNSLENFNGAYAQSYKFRASHC